MKYKVSETTKKQFHCGYIYADGHAVVVYEKTDKEAGRVQFCEIIEKIEAKCDFQGRIVIGWTNGELFNLAVNCNTIRAEEPTVGRGSESMKKKGLPLGSLILQTGESYYKTIIFHDMPGLLSGPYTYQPNIVEKFENNKFDWAGLKVSRIIVEQKEVVV